MTLCSTAQTTSMGGKHGSSTPTQAHRKSVPRLRPLARISTKIASRLLPAVTSSGVFRYTLVVLHILKIMFIFAKAMLVGY